MTNHKTHNSKDKTWHRVAIIAGGFSLIICVLLIVNYIQINRDDPVNTQTIDLLVDRLNQDPADTELREQIREIDLLARKAYFTSQWQIRAGGYMLLTGLAIMIIAWQVIIGNKKKQVVPDQKEEGLLQSQKTARKWISISGAAIVILTLLAAYLSHQELGNKFYTASTGQNDLERESVGLENGNDDKTTNSQNSNIESGDETVERNLTETDGGEIQDSISLAVQNNEKTSATEGSTTSKVNDIFTSFRGTGGNGIVSQKNIPISWNGITGENVLWKTAIPVQGFNSPVLWGNKIFLTGADKQKREVYCLDKNTGKINWAARVDNVPGSPGQAPDVPKYTGHAAPTATTDGKHVFTIFANGDIAALDFDGNIIWSKNLGVPDNHYGHSSSLLMYQDNVIVQYDQSNIKQLIALSASTGEKLWVTNRDVKVAWSSPVIVNTGKRTEIILTAEPLVASYDPNTGKELWSLDCIFGEVGPSVAYADGIVFAMNDYAKLVAIQIGSEPKVLWEDEEYLSDVPSPVATNDYLIIPTSYGMVACYDTKTGERYWEKEFDNTIYASPMIAEGKVYLIDKAGIMHIFNADKEFTLLSEPQLGEKIVCTPAFSEGRIYLRGYEHLYCIGK